MAESLVKSFEFPVKRDEEMIHKTHLLFID